MNRLFVLGKIADLMGWEDDRSRREFAWLRLMSRMKYDDYQEFLAGMRFVESLADWLQQFQQREREAAYAFIRSKLVYLCEAEMRHLVELLYAEAIEPLLLARTSKLTGTPRYATWANRLAAETFRGLLRKTVFIELSDGARMDVLRRANEGRISNEQVVTAPRINKAKWDEMLGKLRKDLQDPEARFAFVVLVDDFTASGKTLHRLDEDGWRGKLEKFWRDVNQEGILNTHLESDWELVVHHYVATAQAIEAARINAARRQSDSEAGPWFERVKFSWGLRLTNDLRITAATCPDFAQLVKNYYNDEIETAHMKVGGDDAKWGFGQCGLPLVLEHNTPNNSVALLWAETNSANGQHAMRPLFRRRQRHV